ncbi:hypothetical protein niasHT_037487 [Heterodera trifolii]|uniref:S-formylglutathione hydrolase n=1 Tax=Heterodera trifolii TaxID=157864 RepID=A0ABD2ILQ6_9BILA
MSLVELSKSRWFNGYQKIFEHNSAQLKCRMRFGVYLPDNQPESNLPVLFYLSGLSCTEENFVIKSAMQRFASNRKIIVVNPDTSPRGVVTGDGDDPSFGAAAGFYLDATETKWAQNYRMYSYILDELVPLVFNTFSVEKNKCGIFGHSMGGHGALTIALKHPELFSSVSAFAPICNPSKAKGQKYLRAFLGNEEGKWANYDATELAKKYEGPKREVLIDQGSADPFLANGDLLPANLLAVENPNLTWKYRLHTNYDHSYAFIQTFIGDHFEHHANCWAI